MCSHSGIRVAVDNHACDYSDAELQAQADARDRPALFQDFVAGCGLA